MFWKTDSQMKGLKNEFTDETTWNTTVSLKQLFCPLIWQCENLFIYFFLAGLDWWSLADYIIDLNTDLKVHSRAYDI